MPPRRSTPPSRGRARPRTRTCGRGSTSADRTWRCRPGAAYGAPVQRLRRLSEAECYARCYGWRGGEDSVRVVQGDAAHPALRGDRLRRAVLRVLFEDKIDSRHLKQPERRPGRPRRRARRRSSAGSTPGARLPRPRAHFANPRNDFWRLLHAAGFTPRLSSRTSSSSCSRSAIGLTNAALAHDAGLGRSAPRRLRRRGGSGSSGSRVDWGRARSPSSARRRIAAPFGERPELGAQERRLGETRALRAAVDLAGKRRGAVGGALALVSGLLRRALDEGARARRPSRPRSLVPRVERAEAAVLELHDAAATGPRCLEGDLDLACHAPCRCASRG